MLYKHHQIASKSATNNGLNHITEFEQAVNKLSNNGSNLPHK